MQEGYPLTPREYSQYVERHGHTPTQDPVYNHAAGDPKSRVSVDQGDILSGNRSNPEADRIESGTMTQAEIDTLIK